MRPGMSAQYALSKDLRFGFIGSSDTHFARAGSGYKEVSPLGMTDLTGAQAIELRRRCRRTFLGRIESSSWG